MTVKEVSEGPGAGLLPNPPEVIKALYFTNSSAANPKQIDYLLRFVKDWGINAVVIDIKDFSGYIGYDINLPEVEKYKTKQPRIKDVELLLKRLHGEGLYVIARMAVFQDPALIRARPDLAVRNAYTGGVWYDRNGLAWADPASAEVQDYYISIAKEAVSRGFDELNFDYIRFPSDGDMSALKYTFWDRKTERRQVLNSFFKKLRTELPDTRLSIDFFGFVTTRMEDFGVGQVMEDAFPYIDFISPMVYPSHYPPGFMGFENPAAYPYEVIYRAMSEGNKRMESFKKEFPGTRAQFRPWIQDFDMGADYTAEMVASEIKATQDALGGNYKGFMLWNAANRYTEGNKY
jgi:hypothetical protein